MGLSPLYLTPAAIGSGIGAALTYQSGKGRPDSLSWKWSLLPAIVGTAALTLRRGY